MMKLIQTMLALAALAALPVLAAGSAGPAMVGSQTLTVTLVEGPRLRPINVRYVWTADGLKVSGRIEKRYDHQGRILGHVDIDLLDAEGAVVGRHSGSLQHFSPTRKDPDWASFRTLIEEVPADVAAIRVQHAVGAR
jgi:hypothetical protein